MAPPDRRPPLLWLSRGDLCHPRDSPALCWVTLSLHSQSSSVRCFGSMGLIRLVTSGYVFLPVGESARIRLPPACLFASEMRQL